MDLHIQQTPNLSLIKTPTSALTEINVVRPGRKRRGNGTIRKNPTITRIPFPTPKAPKLNGSARQADDKIGELWQSFPAFIVQ